MSAMRAVGLVTLGFILGVVVSQLEFSPDDPSVGSPTQTASLQLLNWVGDPLTFTSVDPSGRWRLLSREDHENSAIAIAADNRIRVVIHDDGHSSYYTVYDDSTASWQGRLIDFGNNGKIEVADISYGQCEQFDPLQN